jgi:hypothetical protein
MFTDTIIIHMLSLMLIHYLHSLIQNIIWYKTQDKLGNREMLKDNYITSEWCLHSLGRTCNECKCEFTYTIHANGDITSTITTDRTNNNISHSRDNCNICCVRWNASKSNFNKLGNGKLNMIVLILVIEQVVLFYLYI